MLESIQKTVARFCYNDFSSVTDMLSSLNLPSLQNRTKAKLLVFYKMISGHLMIPMDDLTPKLKPEEWLLPPTSDIN